MLFVKIKHKKKGSYSKIFIISIIIIISMFHFQELNGAKKIKKHTQYIFKLYISIDGNDNWSGKLEIPNKSKTDGPLASLERARDKIFEFKEKNKFIKGNILVEIQEGTYTLSKTFKLNTKDGGFDKDSRIFYKAKEGKEVHFLAGIKLKKWSLITDVEILSKLKSEVRGKVMQVNLRELGLDNFGSPKGEGMELFFNDKAMWLSRDPNKCFVKIAKLLNVDPFNHNGKVGDSKGIFYYNDYQINRWKDEKAAWVFGYWCNDWSEESHKIESIDTLKRILEVKPPYHNYGYRLNQWFYGFNLLNQIDEPGEYYIERERGILYFYPPSNIKTANSFVTNCKNIIQMNDVSNITIQGVVFEGCRETAIQMQNCNDILIEGCTIKNMGGWAIVVNNGKRNGIVGCDIYGSGAGGINIKAGDRTTLDSANNYADNNYIHHIARIKRTYNPGISLNGVGNKATHNLICHVPHMAIGFSGNDQLIEYNEIYDASFESNDAGAIYAGFNLTMRGNLIKNNYLHDISGFEGKGCVGVYLDDMFSSATIEGNIFKNVTRAAMIGGGRDNQIINNIFVDCIPSLHVDARGLGWFEHIVTRCLVEANKNGTLTGRDIPIFFSQPPYSIKYPQLKSLLNDEPKAPKGNIISNNICLRGVWDKASGYWNRSIDIKARTYLKMENNIISPDSKVEDEKSGSIMITDPLFENSNNPEKGKFQLLKNSPAFTKGFKQIPFDKIGLYKTKFRNKVGRAL